MQQSIAAARHSSSVRSLTGTEKILMALLTFTLIAATVISSAGASNPVDTVSVKVRGGDTLWGLAQSYPAPGLDTARTADLIAELNGLETSALRAGATIHVPAVLGSSVAMR